MSRASEFEMNTGPKPAEAKQTPQSVEIDSFHKPHLVRSPQIAAATMINRSDGLLSRSPSRDPRSSSGTAGTVPTTRAACGIEQDNNGAVATPSGDHVTMANYEDQLFSAVGQQEIQQRIQRHLARKYRNTVVDLEIIRKIGQQKIKERSSLVRALAWVSDQHSPVDYAKSVSGHVCVAAKDPSKQSTVAVNQIQRGHQAMNDARDKKLCQMRGVSVSHNQGRPSGNVKMASLNPSMASENANNVCRHSLGHPLVTRIGTCDAMVGSDDVTTQHAPHSLLRTALSNLRVSRNSGNIGRHEPGLTQTFNVSNHLEPRQQRLPAAYLGSANALNKGKGQGYYNFQKAGHQHSMSLENRRNIHVRLPRVSQLFVPRGGGYQQWMRPHHHTAAVTNTGHTNTQQRPLYGGLNPPVLPPIRNSWNSPAVPYVSVHPALAEGHRTSHAAYVTTPPLPKRPRLMQLGTEDDQLRTPGFVPYHAGHVTQGPGHLQNAFLLNAHKNELGAKKLNRGSSKTLTKKATE